MSSFGTSQFIKKLNIFGLKYSLQNIIPEMNSRVYNCVNNFFTVGTTFAHKVFWMMHLWFVIVWSFIDLNDPCIIVVQRGRLIRGNPTFHPRILSFNRAGTNHLVSHFQFSCMARTRLITSGFVRSGLIHTTMKTIIDCCVCVAYDNRKLIIKQETYRWYTA